jgi:hypothetical protein
VIKSGITFGSRTMGEVILLPQPLHPFRSRLRIKYEDKNVSIYTLKVVIKLNELLLKKHSIFCHTIKDLHTLFCSAHQSLSRNSTSSVSYFAKTVSSTLARIISGVSSSRISSLVLNLNFHEPYLRPISFHTSYCALQSFIDTG